MENPGEHVRMKPILRVMLLLSLTVVGLTQNIAAQQPIITAVANAASGVRGLAAGGIIRVFGTNLSSASGVLWSSTFPLPTELGGTQVIFRGLNGDAGGGPGSLLAAVNVNGQEQIVVQVPWDIVGLGCWVSAPDGCDIEVRVIKDGTSGDPVVINTSISQPGIFTVDGSAGIITHADTNQLVTSDAPAASGEVVSIYATGLGPIFGLDSTADGVPAPPDSLIAGPIPAVTIDGQSSEVLNSILAPGLVGVNRVDVRIPAGASSGNVDVILSFPGFICIGRYNCSLWTSNAAKMWVQ
jgi:uncharacterized protein (TIGR03437 family)